MILAPVSLLQISFGDLQQPLTQSTQSSAKKCDFLSVWAVTDAPMCSGLLHILGDESCTVSTSTTFWEENIKMLLCHAKAVVRSTKNKTKHNLIPVTHSLPDVSSLHWFALDLQFSLQNGRASLPASPHPVLPSYFSHVLYLFFHKIVLKQTSTTVSYAWWSAHVYFHENVHKHLWKFSNISAS